MELKLKLKMDDHDLLLRQIRLILQGLLVIGGHFWPKLTMKGKTAVRFLMAEVRMGTANMRLSWRGSEGC